MEGTYKYGRAGDSSSGCGGQIVMPAGHAFGAREAKFPTEDTEEFKIVLTITARTPKPTTGK
jgi:hypothetical protein